MFTRTHIGTFSTIGKFLLFSFNLVVYNRLARLPSQQSTVHLTIGSLSFVPIKLERYDLFQSLPRTITQGGIIDKNFSSFLFFFHEFNAASRNIDFFIHVAYFRFVRQTGYDRIVLTRKQSINSVKTENICTM